MGRGALTVNRPAFVAEEEEYDEEKEEGLEEAEEEKLFPCLE